MSGPGPQPGPPAPETKPPDPESPLDPPYPAPEAALRRTSPRTDNRPRRDWHGEVGPGDSSPFFPEHPPDQSNPVGPVLPSTVPFGGSRPAPLAPCLVTALIARVGGNRPAAEPLSTGHCPSAAAAPPRGKPSAPGRARVSAGTRPVGEAAAEHRTFGASQRRHARPRNLRPRPPLTAPRPGRPRKRATGPRGPPGRNFAPLAAAAPGSTTGNG